MTTRRRQRRRSLETPIVNKAVSTMARSVKPIARTIRMVGEKAISGYLGATNKLANKIQSKLPAKKGTTSSRSRRQAR